MTVDDALYEMELVGHDFFLFHDKETDKPTRRLPPARLRLRVDPAGVIATVDTRRLATAERSRRLVRPRSVTYDGPRLKRIEARSRHPSRP